MENIDEDIKIVEEKLKQWEPYKNIKFSTEIEKELARENQAIENLLSRLKTAEKETEISDQLIERQYLEIDYLKKYLKEAERMNDVLIEVVCNNTVPKEECKDCIKEWARKKVSND